MRGLGRYLVEKVLIIFDDLDAHVRAIREVHALHRLRKRRRPQELENLCQRGMFSSECYSQSEPPNYRGTSLIKKRPHRSCGASRAARGHTALDLGTTASQRCDAVPRRARI